MHLKHIPGIPERVQGVINTEKCHEILLTWHETMQNEPNLLQNMSQTSLETFSAKMTWTHQEMAIKCLKKKQSRDSAG